MPQAAMVVSTAHAPNGSIPPVFPRSAPPPPWFTFRPTLPPPPPSRSNDSSRGRVVAGIFIGIVACVLLYIIVCSLCRGRRDRHVRAAAAAAAGAGPQPVTETSSVRLDERPLRHAFAAAPMDGLPAFAYTLSVKHNVTGPGEEAATCSVCLGALQLGETVRLLPVCLHLYHAECIDPWLDAHSTCPICRSDTDSALGDGRPPHV